MAEESSHAKGPGPAEAEEIYGKAEPDMQVLMEF